MFNWYIKYQREITWWVIGWLSLAVLDSIINEQWILASVNIFLIAVNYKFYKDRY